MEWFLAAYIVGSIVTMGAALAVEVRADRQIEIEKLLFVGLIWPVLWCGVVAYFLLGEPK